MEIVLPYNLPTENRPFQGRILESPAKNLVLVIPRRHGKTSLALAKLVIEAIKNPNKSYYYICPTFKQAKDVVWHPAHMINHLIPTEVIHKKNNSELIIFLKNNSQIHIKGADDPDRLRGMAPQGVVLDEFAQMKPEVYDEVIKPVLIANGGWCWILGTPKGKNHFYTKLLQSKEREGWDGFHFTSTGLGVLSEETLEQARLEMTEKSYKQEFECEFFDDFGSIFARIDVNVKNTLKEPLPGSDYIMGVDLAKHVDFTVISIMDTYTRELVYFDRFNKYDYSLQKSKIEAASRRYNNATIRIDSTGVGDPIVEDLKHQGLSVEPFLFTNRSKVDLIKTLIMLFEQDLIKIHNIEVLTRELKDFTYEITSRGNVRYTAPSGLHDDCVMSLALACLKLSKDRFLRVPDSVQEFNLEYNEFGEPI